MTAPAPLHPNTLAAHLRRKGFVRAEIRYRDFCDQGGWIIHLCPASEAPGFDKFTLELWYRGPGYWEEEIPAKRRAELEKMVAALAPDFEVAEDLGSRVAVRRAVKP